jgi:hypothetical protein
MSIRFADRIMEDYMKLCDNAQLRKRLVAERDSLGGFARRLLKRQHP